METNTTAFLTKQEAAQRLRIGMRTFDRLLAQHEIIGARVGGRRLLFRVEDVDGYVLKQLKQAARN